MNVPSELAQDRGALCASIRDVVNSFGDAGSQVQVLPRRHRRLAIPKSYFSPFLIKNGEKRVLTHGLKNLALL